MKKACFSGNKKRFSTRAAAMCALLFPVVLVAACGVISNPARKETPSRLMLEAQAEYDAGNYSKAASLLEDLLEKDPSNDEARVRLTFAYSGDLGITPLEFVKNFASSSGSSSGSSGTSDIGKLTGKSALPDATITELQKKAGSITSVSQLRTLFPQFSTFQKAFLTICPLFAKSTIADLKVKAQSALEILEISKCGEGRDTANANISIAGLFLALGQFSSLYKAVLDANGDGTIDLQKQATDAKAKIDSLSTSNAANATTGLQTLSAATTALTTVGQTLQGEVFKLAISQAYIIAAVVQGTNLPTDVKSGIDQGVNGLNTALSTINSYLDAGKSAGANTQTGTATTQAAAQAKTKADTLLNQLGNTPEDQAKLDAYCKDIYCFNLIYNTGQVPDKCVAINASRTQEQCTATPTSLSAQ
jgi:hypothetical protein